MYVFLELELRFRVSESVWSKWALTRVKYYLARLIQGSPAKVHTARVLVLGYRQGLEPYLMYYVAYTTQNARSAPRDRVWVIQYVGMR